jgi:hypothetical protein
MASDRSKFELTETEITEANPNWIDFHPELKNDQPNPIPPIFIK